MKRRGSFRDLPKPAIADVLRELGAEDVPTGYGWVRMSCPFHDDRTPSAAVNHDVDGFCCHSCGRQGDGLKLLQAELRIGFAEACDKARAISGDRESATRPARRRRASDLLGGGA